MICEVIYKTRLKRRIFCVPVEDIQNWNYFNTFRAIKEELGDRMHEDDYPKYGMIISLPTNCSPEVEKLLADIPSIQIDKSMAQTRVKEVFEFCQNTSDLHNENLTT